MRVYAKDQGEWYPLTVQGSREHAIRWVDHVLSATTGCSLLSMLNDIQCECNTDERDAFPSKFTMPLCIINLVLKEFNLEIREDGT